MENIYDILGQLGTSMIFFVLNNKLADVRSKQWSKRLL